MIALLLIAAQAAPAEVAPAAPAAVSAPAPATEDWELDQIRFQPPADGATLKPALEAAHTMAAVVDVLDRQHITYQRARVTVAASDFPEAMRRQLEALPPGEPFIIPQAQFTTVNMLVARRPAGAAAAALDPAKVALAEELMRELKSEDQIGQVVRQGVAAMRSGATVNAQIERNDAMKMQRARNPQAWDAASARVGGLQADAMEQVLAGILPELHRRAVAAYVNNFSLAELRQLLAFYRSPAGRNSIERAPAIGAETAGWFQRAFAERLSPALGALQPQIQREFAPLLPQPAK